ncbi:DEAD/DEAH box helicase [Brevibacillus sp. SYSU BS000544]|uniref:DEAD/DEAH box helicase n=1 Tax=Brevibacillus sp. SYSU BS000544 TaxID=3416443 RepID=UPI003CE4F790
MVKSFEEFGLRSEVMQGIKDLFYKEPTQIQAEAIPLILEGKDVIGQAQTGTGKTAAFVLPILQHLQIQKRDIQALILTPTRELSIQIAQEIEKLGKHLGVNALSLHGGTDIERQMNKLERAVHIVVGTPGRILDHLTRETLHFGRITTLVLDEADKMLEMGFLEDVEKILSTTSTNKQVLMFSATMPDQVKRLAQVFMKQPPHLKIETKQKTVERIEQIYYQINQTDKMDALLDIIEVAKPYLAIVFANTQDRVKHLTQRLQTEGYDAKALYGDLSQKKREQLMKEFRNIKFQILVATDIAARGLDVEGVTHVINYDLPSDTESYIHRVGRTGRAGQTGMAISFVSPRQKAILTRIEKAIKTTIEQKLLTPGRHLDAGRRERSKEREEHFSELRKQKVVEKEAEKKKKETPLKEALKKKSKVKPGYKKKLAREAEDLQKTYDQSIKRQEAIKARKEARAKAAQEKANKAKVGQQTRTGQTRSGQSRSSQSRSGAPTAGRRK